MPKRAKTEPQISISVLCHVWVDGVIIVCIHGMDDDPFIHPSVVRICWIQSDVSRQTDRGRIASKTRDRVVEIVFPLVMDDIGRPEISIIERNHLSVPLRLRAEHRGHTLPMRAILRAFPGYADAGGEYIPGVPLFDNHRPRPGRGIDWWARECIARGVRG